MTSESEDSGKAREVSADAVGQALATGAGLMLGGAVSGPAGAVAGAAVGPYAAWATLELARRCFPRRDQSAIALIGRTAEKLGVTDEEIVKMGSESDAKVELSGEAIWAAWHTLNEQKIEALAQALANGLAADDAQVETERLVVAALSAVEAPHIKVLAYLAGVRDFRGPMSVDEVAAACPGFTRATAGAVIAVLERVYCLVRDEVNVGRVIDERQRMRNSGGFDFGSPRAAARYRASDFGRICLGYLEGRKDVFP